MQNLLSTIKNIIINTEPISTHTTSLEIKTYENLISIWKHWKQTKQLNIQTIDDIMLKNFFEFHLNDLNHIIFIIGKNKKTYLLMCKINNEYLNIISPLFETNYDNNMIAIYKFIS